MASVIFVWWGMFLGFKLTKLFGICHFSGVKVLIITTMNSFFYNKHLYNNQQKLQLCYSIWRNCVPTLAFSKFSVYRQL